MANKNLASTLRRMLFLLLALSCCLPAISATVRLSEYQKQEWQVEDGLPQSELRAITQVPGGRLLIATYGGVASFDGLHFSPIRVDAKDRRQRAGELPPGKSQRRLMDRYG